MKKILIIFTIVLGIIITNISISRNIFDGCYSKINATEKVDNYDNPYYDKYISINEDYVAQLVFDSGLIDYPIVQAKSCYRKDGSPYRFFERDGSIVTDISDYTGNDVYLWMDYQTMEYDYFKTGGSLFMDYRNIFNDQNIIIYGHFFPSYDSDPKRIKGFTSLEQLLVEEGYKNNKRVSLFLKEQKLTYELAAVFYYYDQDEYYQDFCQYYRPNFNYDDINDIYDPNYCSYFIDLINSIKLYNTDVSLSPNDRTLTLQTCTSDKDVYEICIFKLINISNY